jgi:hypothetical protein
MPWYNPFTWFQSYHERMYAAAERLRDAADEIFDQPAILVNQDGLPEPLLPGVYKVNDFGNAAVLLPGRTHIVSDSEVLTLDPDATVSINKPVKPIEGVAASIPEGKRRDKHPHVTSVAHAGYCLIVDAFKAFIRERLHEPKVVYVDKAAELILKHYCSEEGWLTPEDSAERITDVKLVGHRLREHLPTLLGCKVIWDAPYFKLTSGEDEGLRSAEWDGTRGRAYSLPFRVLPLVKVVNTPPAPGVDRDGIRQHKAPAIGAEIPHVGPGWHPKNPPTGDQVRPFDNIDDRPASKEEVTTGQSLSPEAQAAIAIKAGPATKADATLKKGCGKTGCNNCRRKPRFL